MAHNYNRSTWNRLTAALAMGLLAGCGGGGEEEPSSDPAALAAYADTRAYCGVNEPVGAPALDGGWEQTSPTRMNPHYEVSALVSPRGASVDFALPLQVGIRDYRGASDRVLMSGAADPEWKMGVVLQGRIPGPGAACVAGLAKLTPPAPSYTIPGLPDAAPDYYYRLNWRSKWDAAAPLGQVQGAVIDGFELVSNVGLPASRVFFTLPKARQADPAGLSVCYLAPKAASWQCGVPGVSDSGRNWTLSRQGAQAGVYVLAGPGGL